MPRRPGRPPGYKPNGAEIYRLRVRVHGLSAAELGAKVGYSVDSVWAAERGQNIGDVLTSRLARALGVEVEDIASRAGDDTGSDTEPKVPAA
jgi:transcriptional regulator with XRE-family HTH domain